MTNKVNKTHFANSITWKFFEVFSKKIFTLITSTLLARVLLPEAYGAVALTTVFINFSDIFIISGFNVALIRKEKAERVDYSTVMVLGLVFSLVAYCVIFVIAPLVAHFFKTPVLSSVLRVITILLFFQAISAVIRAKATRDLCYKQMSIISVLSGTTSGVIAVVLAYCGAGVWALVAQQILTNLLDMVLLIIAFRWKLSFRLSLDSAKGMLRFTVGVLQTSILEFMGNSSAGLIIGRSYNPTQLGYYNRGYAYPETVGLNLYHSINSVVLPAFSERQKDIEALKRATRRVVSISEYILIPLMVGFAAVSDRFVIVLLTEKWLPCVPVMVFANLSYALHPIKGIENNVFFAIGQSKKTAKLESIRSTIQISNVIITILLLKQSIFVLAVTNMLVGLIVITITHCEVKATIGYKFSELFQDVFPTALLAAMMALCVRGVTLLPLTDFWMLCVQIFVGVVVFVSLSAVTRNENLLILWGIVKQKLR